MSKIDDLINKLEKANSALKEATGLVATQIHRDATIRRFKFCFELCWKTMQEYIRDQGFDCKSPKNCFREAAKLDLTENPEDWFDYLEKRNLIAHTYNQGLADAVYKAAVNFPQEVEKLLQKLKGE